MIGNTIIFRDINLNEVKARVLGKVLVAEEHIDSEEIEYFIAVTRYLCKVADNGAICLVNPKSIFRID